MYELMRAISECVMEQGLAHNLHNLVISDVLKGIRLDWVADGVTTETLAELQKVPQRA